MTVNEADPEQVQAVVKRVRDKVQVEGGEWPGGWPGKIEAAVIDAVFSIRANYGSPTNGVRAVVSRWQDHRGTKQVDDLAQLAKFKDDPEGILAILGNEQKLSGGMLKAKGCALVAQCLIDVGIQTSKDDKAESDGRRAWNSVYGLGNVTWSYTRMLLGHQDVKADRMIQRFVKNAFNAEGIDATANAKVARSVVIAAAKDLSVEPVTLDHAIWQHQRRL